MAVATQVLVPALREVRVAEAALADRLGAHAAVTPVGAYRESLERRMGDVRDHVHRIDERLDLLQPRGRVRGVLGGALRLSATAARLPFEVAMAVPAVVLRGRATQRQLLNNVEEQYGVTAKAVTRCRAGEHLARQIGDAPVAPCSTPSATTTRTCSKSSPSPSISVPTRCWPPRAARPRWA